MPARRRRALDRRTTRAERIDRPLEHAALAEVRVFARIVVGQSDAERVGDLGEEHAAVARSLRARPARPGQQQVIARARDGDVREPAVLVELTCAVGGDERVDRRLQILLRRRGIPLPPQCRQPPSIAAERVGQDAEAEPPLRVARRAGQLVLDEPHDGDGIPLEPLRAVDREQLDDVVLGRLGARRELVELLGVVEPGEQARERTRLVGGEERVQLVDERPQLRRRDPRGPARLVRGELDVEPQLQLDQPHQVGHRHAHRLAEAGEDGCRLAQPLACLGGEPAEPAVVGLVAQDEVERVDERAVVVAGTPPDALDDLRRQRLERGVVPRDAAGERGELAQIGQPDRPARPGQQADERRARARDR